MCHLGKKTYSFGLRITKEVREKLDKLMKKTGKNQSDVIADLIINEKIEGEIK